MSLFQIEMSSRRSGRLWSLRQSQQNIHFREVNVRLRRMTQAEIARAEGSGGGARADQVLTPNEQDIEIVDQHTGLDSSPQASHDEGDEVQDQDSKSIDLTEEEDVGPRTVPTDTLSYTCPICMDSYQSLTDRGKLSSDSGFELLSLFSSMLHSDQLLNRTLIIPMFSLLQGSEL